jgi:adenylate cyclase class 2
MSSDRPREREQKFSGVELEALRERLTELEAERVSSASFEDNWVLDKGDALGASGRLLLLRVDSQGALLTLKGPVFENGSEKAMPGELQTSVGDAEQMRALLEALGYRVVRRYQKVREEWRLGGVVISLDHTPIGDFVEFEGDGGETVARRCGFDAGRAERRSYLELYEEYKKEHPEAPPEMVFP